VMNMHPHAWPLYETVKLIGAEFTPDGLVLAPVLPQASYRFDSPLLGLEKTNKGYSGWYAPLKAGSWHISLRLPEKDRDRFKQLKVNGRAQSLKSAAQGQIEIVGESTGDKPLRWSLTKAG